MKKRDRQSRLWLGTANYFLFLIKKYFKFAASKLETLVSSPSVNLASHTLVNMNERTDARNLLLCKKVLTAIWETSLPLFISHTRLLLVLKNSFLTSPERTNERQLCAAISFSSIVTPKQRKLKTKFFLHMPTCYLTATATATALWYTCLSSRRSRVRVPPGAKNLFILVTV